MNSGSEDRPQPPAVQAEVVNDPRRGPSSYPPPPQVVIQQSGSRFGRFVAWLGWLGLIVCIPVILGMMVAFRDYFDTTGGIQERYHSLAKHGRNKVAVIRIEGIILEGDGYVKRQIDRVRKDKKVKAIVVRIDSPGGTVTGADYLYHHLLKLKKEKNVPLVVSMGGMAVSGGYYVAMAVGEQERSIFAEPTTTTGSIGVIVPHYDLSGFLKRYDIKNDSITSHPRKQLLSMTKEMSPEDREIVQQYVNESFERFKQIVRQGRPVFQQDQEALGQLATGEIFSAMQAKGHGLIDEIGFVEDAIQRAVELARLSRDNVRVVTYQRIPTLLGALRFGQQSANPWESLALELSVPRAFYLATTLPPLVQAHSERGP